MKTGTALQTSDVTPKERVDSSMIIRYDVISVMIQRVPKFSVILG